MRFFSLPNELRTKLPKLNLSIRVVKTCLLQFDDDEVELLHDAQYIVVEVVDIVEVEVVGCTLLFTKNFSMKVLKFEIFQQKGEVIG